MASLYPRRPRDIRTPPPLIISTESDDIGDIMIKFNRLEFTCPWCGNKHNILGWIDGYRSDDDVLMANLEEGYLHVSFPYVQCGCGSEYIVDIEQGYVTIYDDRNDIVYQEGFKG